MSENIIVLIVVLFAIRELSGYAQAKLFITGRSMWFERRHVDDVPHGVGDEWSGARSVTALHEKKR